MGANMESLYREFVRERHAIWEQRVAGEPGPWTSNHVLAIRKFTNVFRILDPGTQFICQVMDTAEDARHAAFVAHLYRHTGSIPAWQFWYDWTGRWPHPDDSEEVLLLPWRDFRDDYAGRLFTAAYNVFPQTTEKGTEKIESIVRMSLRFWETPMGKVFTVAEDLPSRVKALQQPGVGNFMSMQISTDFGYSRWAPEDWENTWVLAGPGAVTGTKHLERAGETAEDTIRWAQQELWGWADCPLLPLPGGRHRAPSLMDVQNTFCEFGKYVRALKSDRVPKEGEHYQPKTVTTPPEYLPRNWLLPGD